MFLALMVIEVKLLHKKFLVNNENVIIHILQNFLELNKAVKAKRTFSFFKNWNHRVLFFLNHRLLEKEDVLRSTCPYCFLLKKITSAFENAIRLVHIVTVDIFTHSVTAAI